MKVVFFSSEVFPYAKTGGLADVSAALPKALKDLGNDIKIFMPLYKEIKAERVNEDYSRIQVDRNLEIIFINHNGYFIRDNLYTSSEGDYPDNIERFAFFCRKSLQVLKYTGFSPDILHCNDWQTALIPVYCKTLYKQDPFYEKAKVVLTIHNLAFQGYFDQDKFDSLGLDKGLQPLFSAYSRLNTLKAGIITCDRLTTVSPSYAQEVQAEPLGCGLGQLLKKYNFKLSGILNAVDYDIWDPQKDKYIYRNYNKETLVSKQENKVALQKECGFGLDREKILFGMVSRLTEQKGMDILSEGLTSLLSDFEFVILGKGQDYYEEVLKNLENRYPSNFKLFLKFDEAMAHRIYSGCDVVLIPSRFEPCGLSQLIGFKYGTVPLAYSTGGLKDTVKDFFNDQGHSTGFTFNDYSHQAFNKVLLSCSQVFKDRVSWLGLQKRIIDADFSWKKQAIAYMNLYRN